MALLSKLRKFTTFILKFKRFNSVSLKKVHTVNNSNTRLPSTIEERWRIIRNSYQREGCGYLDADDSEGEFDLIKVCGACGVIRHHKRPDDIDASEDDERGHYAYAYHSLNRIERKRRRLQLERIIVRKNIEVERLLKMYQNGYFD